MNAAAQDLAGADGGAQAAHQLRLENVAKAYGGVRALKPTTTTFRQGLTGIVGDNGAGKSTLDEDPVRGHYTGRGRYLAER